MANRLLTVLFGRLGRCSSISSATCLLRTLSLVS
jgi:hypothetical protein